MRMGRPHSPHRRQHRSQQRPRLRDWQLRSPGRRSRGKNRFEIRLDPPELGRIEVRIDVDHDGNVTSRLTVDRADTYDLLRRDATDLERALQDAVRRQRIAVLAARSIGEPATGKQRRYGTACRAGRHVGGRRSAADLQPPCRPGRRSRYSRLRTNHDDDQSHFHCQYRLGVERARQHRDRQQFYHVSAASNDAAEKPKSAGSARHQPIHPAARGIRSSRAANEIQRSIVEPAWYPSKRARKRPPRLRMSGRLSLWTVRRPH